MEKKQRVAWKRKAVEMRVLLEEAPLPRRQRVLQILQ